LIFHRFQAFVNIWYEEMFYLKTVEGNIKQQTEEPLLLCWEPLAIKGGFFIAEQSKRIDCNRLFFEEDKPLRTRITLLRDLFESFIWAKELGSEHYRMFIFFRPKPQLLFCLDHF
jgi:hypothetical protein